MPSHSTKLIDHPRQIGSRAQRLIDLLKAASNPLAVCKKAPLFCLSSLAPDLRSHISHLTPLSCDLSFFTSHSSSLCQERKADRSSTSGLLSSQSVQNPVKTIRFSLHFPPYRPSRGRVGFGWQITFSSSPACHLPRPSFKRYISCYRAEIIEILL